ncbi:MAG TPA: hypothetical protein VMU92_10555 [Acidobacteriaceae bacterium]|nr:hypothetical protein [Acidobacteriaceae bacterium]
MREDRFILARNERSKPQNKLLPAVHPLRYAVAVANWRKLRRIILALFVIGCFVTIFVVGIIWATRPAHKGGSRFR